VRDRTLGRPRAAAVRHLAPGGYFFRCLARRAAHHDVDHGVGGGSRPAPGQLALAVARSPWPTCSRPPMPTTATSGRSWPSCSPRWPPYGPTMAANQLPAAQRDWLAAQLTGSRSARLTTASPTSGTRSTDCRRRSRWGCRPGVHRAAPAGVRPVARPTAAALLPVTDQLSADITALTGKLSQLTLDPTDLPVRAPRDPRGRPGATTSTG